MLYEFNYIDEEGKLITQRIKADTDRKARNRVEKILEGKVFKAPELFLIENESCGAD